MSLESEIKKLRESIDEFNKRMSAAEPEKPVTQAEPEPDIQPEVQQEMSEAPLEVPTITRKDLGEYLRNLSLKYGAPAQEKMAAVAIETADTQALSQIPEELLGLFKVKMEQWVGEQTGD